MNIYALSSGRGPSGIAIVRISGKSSLQVCKNLTQLKEIKSNEVNFCKFYDPKTKNVKKVNFGDPNMKIKKSNPKRRKSFRARHNCDNPGPRTKARYWSCRKW